MNSPIRKTAMPYASHFLFFQWKSISSKHSIFKVSELMFTEDPGKYLQKAPSKDKPGTKSLEVNRLIQICTSSGFTVHYDLPLTHPTTPSKFIFHPTEVWGPCPLLTALAAPRCWFPSLPQSD